MTALRSALAAIALLNAAPLYAAPGFAQAPAPIPRTANGQPDFHGVWTTQFPPFFFQRTGPTKELLVDDAKALAIAREIYEADQTYLVQDPGDALDTVYKMPKVNGEWRTSMVTVPEDGVARLTPKAEEITASFRAMFEAAADGHEMRDWSERCLVGTGNAPFGMFPTQNLREFVQTGDNLVIYSEDQGDTRIIGIGAQPRPAAIISFLGDSVARWEGDVLVVETTGQRGERPARSLLPGLMVGADARVIERFSLIGPDELLYRFTVEDPSLYAAPWSAEYSMTRRDVTTYEHACHEGNYAIPDILLIARNRDPKPALKRR